MARAEPSQRHRPAAQVFREEIEKGLGAGVKAKDMTLQLTLRDMADIKRDRTLALSDISFSDGVMKFLGVTVSSGGVTASRLDLGGA